jgi:hypothetical protein
MHALFFVREKVLHRPFSGTNSCTEPNGRGLLSQAASHQQQQQHCLSTIDIMQGKGLLLDETGAGPIERSVLAYAAQVH